MSWKYGLSFPDKLQLLTFQHPSHWPQPRSSCGWRGGNRTPGQGRITGKVPGQRLLVLFWVIQIVVTVISPAWNFPEGDHSTLAVSGLVAACTEHLSPEEAHAYHWGKEGAGSILLAASASVLVPSTWSKFSGDVDHPAAWEPRTMHSKTSRSMATCSFRGGYIVIASSISLKSKPE